MFQVHDLQTKLGTARETIQQLKDQVNQSDAERRLLDQQATSYKLQIDELRKQFDDTAHERDRSKTALETSNYERTNMDKLRLVSLIHSYQLLVPWASMELDLSLLQTLSSQIDSLRADCDRLQQANTDLQRQRDIVEEEKEDLQKDKSRQVKENERCIKVIENLENKISQLKKDVTELREQYHKEKLAKDVLTQEKHVICKWRGGLRLHSPFSFTSRGIDTIRIVPIGSRIRSEQGTKWKCCSARSSLQDTSIERRPGSG